MNLLKSCVAVVAAINLAGCDAATDAVVEAEGDLGDHVMGSAAQDQIEVYEIAKRNGDKMQTCMQAGMIAQFFLQSKDEASWKEWSAKEDEDCEAAGIPNM